ncbi:hypothetical protein QQX09_01765 [Demequina sp. SYSU T00192]|uniref:Uncharacterized protein n=1 Tax=Demequina litoralis TaxID=3051660 RepID=A0ABT8G610_9MICO|nr:hypothetical protein [Demequina sp. SYSU T00192]MDN4474573.1 hypothetical protein [Demequina sp. SYSU T00192]
MSGLPGRAPETHEGAPPCPVHPYGFHARPRVRPAGSPTVFRDASPIGLPARCAQLEHELDDADRELEFIDELWMRERAARGFGLTLLGVALAAALVAALVLGSASTGAVVAAVLVGGAVTVGLDRADRAIHRERLRRVRDWHRRVGTPR